MIRLEKIRRLSLGFQQLVTVRNSSSNPDINIEKLEKDSLISDNLRKCIVYIFCRLVTIYFSN